MKKYLLLFLYFITSNLYGQVNLTFDHNYRNKLIDHMIEEDPLTSDFIKELKRVSLDKETNSIKSSVEVYSEALCIIDSITGKKVLVNDNMSDICIYIFFCPMINPRREFILLKYYEDLTILDPVESFEEAEKQICWFVNSYIKTHDDLPENYPLKYLQIIISTSEDNLTYLE